MIPLHMGALHPVEQVLTLVLAFGPFALLALVVWLRRRADRRAELSEQQSGATSGQTSAQTGEEHQADR